MKVKDYVCGYNHCLHKGERVPSDEAVKDGTRYLHPDCFEDKKNRNQILDLYYKYYKSKEDIHEVRSVINVAIEMNDSSSEYVLYTLCQSIKQKIPYKSIKTLAWLVKNSKEIRDKYNAMKCKEKVKQFNFNDIETKKHKDIKYKISNDDSWEKTLFG